MKNAVEVFKDVTGRTSVRVSRKISHLLFTCTSGSNCKDGGSIVSEKGTGFNNLTSTWNRGFPEETSKF